MSKEETKTEEPAVEETEEPANKEEGLVSDAKIEEEKEEVPEDIPHKESDEPAEPEIKAESKEEEKALEQPEWLPDKFWDEKEGMDVESLSKSYQSLEKKLGSQNKAPKEYDLSALKDIPEDDPLRQKYVEWADNNKITQDGFNELAEAFIEMSNAQQEQSQTDIDSERKKLGPNADALINGSVDWAKSLVDKGIWGEDDFEEYKVFAGTANGLKALNKVRRYYEGPIIPTSTPDAEGMPSKEELYSMVSDPKYKTDVGFRKKVEDLFGKMYPGKATDTGEII